MCLKEKNAFEYLQASPKFGPHPLSPTSNWGIDQPSPEKVSVLENQGKKGFSRFRKVLKKIWGESRVQEPYKLNPKKRTKSKKSRFGGHAKKRLGTPLEKIIGKEEPGGILIKLLRKRIISRK